ncbi:hypothetical protein BUALT_Bualt12G0067400 [Buddleja alternifolia]|uniref:Serine carboxypeptidase n=1 Tax=Buddleja alternifolia TaxID=168488 RepID=A0AAV6WNZ3_9LAMI|nr:hypothetical protein BUALT_Bualt12G0067400 [Buddleja alternifolia]
MLLLMVLMLLFFISNNTCLSQHVIENLPGFPGKLPFTLETGYIGVGEKEDVQLFYYFVESESNPETDPLILWLTGGPGCSGLSDLVYKIGPISIDYENSEGSIPPLILNENSWTKVANIIFIDQPVGTGFSYTNTLEASYSNDTLSATLTYDLLRKWLISHPQFQKNPLYICGDSYSGIIVPLVVNEVYNGIEGGSKPHMNMKSAKENCHGNYVYVDPENDLCLNDLEKITQCLDKISYSHILEPYCGALWKERRGVRPWYTPSYEEIPTNFIESVVPTTKSWCRDETYMFLHTWANNKLVQKALHIHEGTVIEWVRCNRSIEHSKTGPDGAILYIDNVPSTISYHKKFTYKNCRALIYSGDHDMVIPHLSTEKWIDSILPIQSDWRPWFVEGQVAGYTMTYGDGDYQLTYATVKGAGHTAPEYKPKECFAMINRWFAQSSM